MKCSNEMERQSLLKTCCPACRRLVLKQLRFWRWIW